MSLSSSYMATFGQNSGGRLQYGAALEWLWLEYTRVEIICSVATQSSWPCSTSLSQNVSAECQYLNVLKRYEYVLLAVSQGCETVNTEMPLSVKSICSLTSLESSECNV